MRQGDPAKRDPRKFEWGFSIVENNMGVFSSFWWFKSPEELLRFIVDAVTPQYAQCSENEGKIIKEMQKVIGDADLCKGLTVNLLRKVNNILETTEKNNRGPTIHWWGTFPDLCSGKGAWSQKFIADFFENCVDQEIKPTKKIREAQITDFIQYCREYGH